jgi:uncharacterized OsmC-like protein
MPSMSPADCNPPTTTANDPATLRVLRCRTVATGRFHQLNYIRDLPPAPPMTEGETDDLLGEDTVPNALEGLLAAFGSCLALGIHATAVAHRVPIRRLELELEADITSAGWGTIGLDPGSIGFETVRVSVQLDADAPPEILAAIVKHATLWSPVANTLHNPVHLDVQLQA